ncbi:MAG: hypothetical protein WC637_08345, partial [Victivallales bacterium]
HQISEKDEKFKPKLPINGVGDEFMDSILKTIQDENAKDIIAIPEIHNPGPLDEESMSKGDALTRWLLWQQPSVRYRMYFNGWTKESIAQLEKFLSPDMPFKDSPWYKAGKGMVDKMKADVPEINKVLQSQYLSTLPVEENYFPSAYEVKSQIGKGVGDLSDPYGGNATVTPGAIYARRHHYKEPKYENAFSVFVRHEIQMTHFKTHASLARDLSAVFGSFDVQSAIRQNFGDATLQALHNKITDIVNGGNKDATRNAAVDAMQGVFAKTRIFANTTSLMKQALSGFAFAAKIPSGAWVKHTMGFITNPHEYADTAKMLMDTPYFKMRFSGGMDRDVSAILAKNAARTSDNINRFAFLDDLGSLPVRVGDAFATLIGGTAVYKYHYDSLIKDGMSPAMAHREALTKWELATEETQQSANPANLNRIQLGGSYSRLFTTFLGNPITLMNDLHNAISDVIHSRGAPKERYAYAAKSIANAYILGGFVMAMAGQAAKHGIELDEYEWMRVIKDTLFNPYAAYNAIGMGMDAAFAAAFNIPGAKSTAIDDLGSIGYSVAKIPSLLSGDLEAEDAYKTIEKTMIPIAMIGALGVPGAQAINPITTNAAAVMRELRKYWNLFGGGEK